MKDTNKIGRIDFTIVEWKGSYFDLVKQFTKEDYTDILNENGFGWRYVDIEDAREFYDREEWDYFLGMYLREWLATGVLSGDRSGMTNIFRLWYEST